MKPIEYPGDGHMPFPDYGGIFCLHKSGDKVPELAPRCTREEMRQRIGEMKHSTRLRCRAIFSR